MLLDQERERANRLEREKREDEEALSGELRDIMANVAGTTTKRTTAQQKHQQPARAGRTPGIVDNSASKMPETAAVGKTVENNAAGMDALVGGGVGTAETPSAELTPWSIDDDEESVAGVQERLAEGKQRQQQQQQQQNQQNQQQQGALRWRVVELELQRQEAVDALKIQTDRSLRLEVQVT